MFHLIMTVFVLIAGVPGEQEGKIVRVEYPTQYTCDTALSALDVFALERTATRWYARRHRGPQTTVRRVVAECRRNELVDPKRDCALDWRATCSNTINRI